MIQQEDASQTIWETLSITLLTRYVNIVMLDTGEKAHVKHFFSAEWDVDDILHYELLVISSLVLCPLWNRQASIFLFDLKFENCSLKLMIVHSFNMRWNTTTK